MQNLPVNSQDPSLVERYRTSMQTIFGQVNKLLSNLLSKISYIYISHGLTTNVKHYHSILMKMLIPPQLLSYVHFWAPAGQFKDQAIQILGPHDKNNIQQPLPKNNILITQKVEPKIEKHEQFFKKQPIRNQEKIYKSQKVQKFQKSQVQDSDYDSELQQNLCNSIQDQVKKGLYLTRSDVIRQAFVLQIIKSPNGSKWFKKFMKRHPEIKNLMKKQKVQKNENKREVTIQQESRKQKISQLAAKLKAKMNKQYQVKYQNEHRKLQQDRYIKLSDPKKSLEQQYEELVPKIQIKKQQKLQNQVIPEKRTNLKQKYLGDLYKRTGNDDNRYQQVKSDSQIEDHQSDSEKPSQKINNQQKNKDSDQSQKSKKQEEYQHKIMNQMGKDSHQYRRSFGQKNAGLSQSNRAIRQRIKTIFFKL